MKIILVCFLVLSLLSIDSLKGQVDILDFSGVVIDTTTKAPVANMNVFVANTTIGTITNQNGEFDLRIVPMSHIEIVFSHVSYELKVIYLGNLEKSVKNRKVYVYPMINVIDEVVISANKVSKRKKDASRIYCESVIREFLLGDLLQSECILRNPEILVFSKQGSRFYATAKSPLVIDNYRLGYTLKYNLEYFIFQEIANSDISNVNNSFYSFKGTALYKKISTSSRLAQKRWVDNRTKAYAGSLTNFLSTLNRNQLSENHYTVIKPGYLNGTYNVLEKRIESKMDVGTIDSVLFFDETENKQRYLSYFPSNLFPINKWIREGSTDGCKILKFVDTLLIFRDFIDTPYLYDDETVLFSIGPGQLTFNELGDYQIYGGDLIWCYLNYPVKLINLLPLDYLQKDDK